jgi:3',5'-cyclic AMP phosphodiesterase CpdA
MTLAHLSDLHFGRIAHPNVVGDLVREVNGREVDLVALSGDLTQRARPAEFRAARAMIDALDPPTLVVPGNHDVYPWWQPIRRVVQPLGRYQRFITDDLMPTHDTGRAAVLGVSTAFGTTIKSGRITRRELRAIQAYFEAREAATFKVLVLHHHLTQMQALGRHDVARQAEEALSVAARSGVDLVLCGHLHVSHIKPVTVDAGQGRIVIASAGTATSNRGRRWHRQTNHYNLITVGEGGFRIEEREYDPDRECFVRDDVTTFERPGTGSEREVGTVT